jgi:hypothetical protein
VKTNNKIAKRITPVFLNYGGAKKFIADMTSEELETARKSILRRAREKAFSKGLPIYYSRKGKLLAEHPDGKVVIVQR